MTRPRHAVDASRAIEASTHSLVAQPVHSRAAAASDDHARTGDQTEGRLGRPVKADSENVPPDQFERAMKAAMARNDTDLDLTEEEQNKFTKAFQDKEFRKMMAEYVDEISDPKHRAEQDAYIREMEAKGETPKDKRVIHPAAGFVVKTKKEDGAKLFINVVSVWMEVEQPTSTTLMEAPSGSCLI